MKAKDVLDEIEKESEDGFLPIVGPIKGKLLEYIVKKYKPLKILEVGTLVGYSTILMAQNLAQKAKITTIEIDPNTAEIARENFKKAGVTDLIELKVGDALKLIPKLKGLYYMLFLDATKEEYLSYLRKAEAKLASGAVVVADNVKIFEDEMNDYLEYVRKSGKYQSTTYDFGSDAMEVSIKK